MSNKVLAVGQETCPERSEVNPVTCREAFLLLLRGQVPSVSHHSLKDVKTHLCKGFNILQGKCLQLGSSCWELPCPGKEACYHLPLVRVLPGFSCVSSGREVFAMVTGSSLLQKPAHRGRPLVIMAWRHIALMRYLEAK
ncbi:unnamed protein product [Leuciscus chuanchicus]